MDPVPGPSQSSPDGPFVRSREKLLAICLPSVEQCSADTVALSLVDFDFAKEQLLLMLRDLYAHRNGQIPAYEWNFSDVNPPVHAWATLFLYRIETELGRPTCASWTVRSKG